MLSEKAPEGARERSRLHPSHILGASRFSLANRVPTLRRLRLPQCPSRAVLGQMAFVCRIVRAQVVRRGTRQVNTRRTFVFADVQARVGCTSVGHALCCIVFTLRQWREPCPSIHRIHAPMIQHRCHPDRILIRRRHRRTNRGQIQTRGQSPGANRAEVRSSFSLLPQVSLE